MSGLTHINKTDLLEILNKNWMTHDAMWLFHCLRECGIEKTNHINKAAVKSMAAVECKRIRKQFGINTVETFAELKEFLNLGAELIRPKFMKFSFFFPAENRMRWVMHECFAYEGIKRIEVIDQYECGIFERPAGWFDALNIKYNLSPEITGCMMHDEGKCHREFLFHFPE